MLRNALDGGRLNEQKPARCLHYMNVIVPGGGITIELDEDQAAEYNADPDACAARFVGLAKFEYLLWVDLNGAPLCGARPQVESCAEMRAPAGLGFPHPNGRLGAGRPSARRTPR
jgi:hypothetical protein